MSIVILYYFAPCQTSILKKNCKITTDNELSITLSLNQQQS
jgi:hypothetical protein